jgi:DNA-binding IscR family transcriptional regulator
MARPPEQISVLEVVEAIDGPISLNECQTNGASCPMGEKCPLRSIWCNTQREMVEKLRYTTFSQVMASQLES